MNKLASSTVRKIIGPTILLHGGTYFDFLDPENSSFTIEDIAHGLSMICRFTGHCDRFYSVAEHSIYVSLYVPPTLALAGLMHDAAEAFIGDVSRPLKDLIPAYRKIERHIETAVLRRFGLEIPIPSLVKEIDDVLLATEQRQLMRNRDDWDHTHGRRPLPIELACWLPEEARKRFLERYRYLIEWTGPGEPAWPEART
jgi:uncharacterized protein